MSVPETLFQCLLKAGTTIEGACAVLGNVQWESAFKPTNVEDRSGIDDAVYTQQVDSGARTRDQFIHDSYGYGLAQWTYYTRKALMYDYMRGRNLSIGDLNGQIEFLIWEMKNYFPVQWKLICENTELYKCTWELLDKWENPKEKIMAMSNRYGTAQKFLNEFSGWEKIPAGSNPKTVDVDEDGIEIERTWPPRTIDKGVEWKEVKLLEALLCCHGYNVLIDGIFADSLDKKVKEYQQANGLEVDGVVGPKTWKKLLELPKGF